MFIYTVYDKIVLGIHIESKVANTDKGSLLRKLSQQTKLMHAITNNLPQSAIRGICQEIRHSW